MNLSYSKFQRSLPRASMRDIIFLRPTFKSKAPPFPLRRAGHPKFKIKGRATRPSPSAFEGEEFLTSSPFLRLPTLFRSVVGRTGS